MDVWCEDWQIAQKPVVSFPQNRTKRRRSDQGQGVSSNNTIESQIHLTIMLSDIRSQMVRTLMIFEALDDLDISADMESTATPHPETTY